MTISTDLSLKRLPLEGGCVIVADGSIDSTTAQGFAEYAAQLPEAHRCILVDLFGIRYLSSAGLGALLGLMKAVRARDGRFALYDPSLPVRRVLEISKLDFLDVKAQADSGTAFDSYVERMDAERDELRKKRDAEFQKRFQRPQPPPSKKKSR